MKEIYEKVWIKSADDLPKREGTYFCHVKGVPNGEKGMDIFDWSNNSYEWINTFDWYLRPIEPVEQKAAENEITKDDIDFKERVIKEYEDGNIVYLTVEGAEVMKLDDILQQPTDGLLYDLNRNEAIILTFINDPKWVNDYAMCKIVRKLHASQFKQPVEQLTDEDIEKALLNEIPFSSSSTLNVQRMRWDQGAKWARDQINNKSKL